VFCSKCGANLAADAVFCTSCGTPLARPAPATPGAVGVPPNVGVAGFSGARGGVIYAGFWLRFVAHMIDGLLVGCIVLAIFLPLAILTGTAAHLHGLEHMRGNHLDPEVVAAILTLVFTLAGASVLATWLYYAYSESSSWQATVGKHVMSIYVTDLNGNHITFLHATGRYFAKIITGLIPLGIGYIMAGFTERRQALHDMIAGTLVLRR